tara:strand:+ start:334 stop:462 length:129 start_codon:yes stop_codon:yes gene_type:complete
LEQHHNLFIQYQAQEKDFLLVAVAVVCQMMVVIHLPLEALVV